MIGQTISHYRVVSQLGAGGMGLVYRAHDLKLGRQVALKFLAPGTSDPETVERFRREARTASALSHPNICTIYEIDEWHGELFIAMEVLDGTPLNRLIAAGPLPLDRAVDHAIQVADALDAAHGHNVVHRDIKPANLFVTARGQLKVLDFGLAKVLAPRGTDSAHESATMMVTGRFSTAAGSTLGTIAYMSPEQARGESLDGRSDLFSFGLVLYEMLTGRHTFSGQTSAVIFDAILNRPHTAPSLHNQAVSPSLDHIIAKALEKDRRHRYQTASDMRADLERARRDMGRASQTFVQTVKSDPWLAAAASAASSPQEAAASAPALPPATPPYEAPASGVAPSGGPGTVIIAAPATHRALLASIGALLLVVGALGAMVVIGRPRTDASSIDVRAAAGREPAEAAPATAVTGPERPNAAPPPAAFPVSAPSNHALEASSGARAADIAPAPVTPPSPRPAEPAASTRAADVDSRAVAAPPLAAAAPMTPAALPPSSEIALSRPPSAAAPLLDGALPRDPHPVNAAMFRAETFERDGQPDEAIQVYREAAASYRAHPRAAEAMFRQAQLVAGPRPGRRAKAFTPGPAGNGTAYDRATRLMEGAPLGPGAARTILENLAAQHPTSPWTLRGLMFKAELEDRLGIDDDDPMLGGVAPASLATYRQVTELFPHAPPAEEARWRLAAGYERLGRADLAVRVLAELATVSPQTTRPVWFRLGVLYHDHLHEAAKARDAFVKVLPGSRDFNEAQRRLGQLSK